MPQASLRVYGFRPTKKAAWLVTTMTKSLKTLSIEDCVERYTTVKMNGKYLFLMAFSFSTLSQLQSAFLEDIQLILLKIA